MTKDELPLSKGEAKILRELEKLRARATALEERSKELEKVHKTKPGSTLSVQYLRWEADRLYFSNDCLRRHNAQLTRALNQITSEPIEEPKPSEPTVTRAPALPKCTASGKRRFTSEKRARKVRARSTHDRLRVYQCPFCMDWHLTRAV